MKKPHNQVYRLVHDLRAVNQLVVNINPVVPSPYTLVTTVKESNEYFYVLDLKDAVSCISLEENRPRIFMFEWEDTSTGKKTQLCWTVLPQGFKTSLNIFGTILARELEQSPGKKNQVTRLQCVDDSLLGADTAEICKEMTISLLNFLGMAGYQVSEKKAQIVKQSVIYLVFEIFEGQQKLGNDRKEVICRMPPLQSKKELRGFLGMTGWCHLCIPNFDLIAKPLYEATKGPEELQVSALLNPASLMPAEEISDSDHDFLQVIEQVYASRPDLKDVFLEPLYEELCTDRSNFVVGGERKAGYAVVTLTVD